MKIFVTEALIPVPLFPLKFPNTYFIFYVFLSPS